jgi:hypothetical protein
MNMKNSFSFRRFASVALAAAGLMVLVASCKKGLDQGTPLPASGLMVLNLSPDQNALGVALSGNLISNAPLGYTNFNGNYQNIYTGEREISVYDFLNDSVIAKSSFNFENNELYSLFVTGNKGVYSPLVVKDEVDSTSSTEKAYVRFVNAIPDSSEPNVTVNAAGTKVFDGPAGFRTVSPFAEVNEGDVTIAVSGTSNINANRTIKLQKGWVYTALLVGDPAATDSSRKVQIRYIQNGVVPATSGK